MTYRRPWYLKTHSSKRQLYLIKIFFVMDNWLIRFLENETLNLKDVAKSIMNWLSNTYECKKKWLKFYIEKI